MLSTAIETCFYSGFRLRANTQTKDSGGANIDSWSDGVEFDGHIRRLSSSEIIANNKRGINSSHRLSASADLAITKTNRVTFDSKEYHVTFVDDVHELAEFLQIELFYDEVES